MLLFIYMLRLPTKHNTHAWSRGNETRPQIENKKENKNTCGNFPGKRRISVRLNGVGQVNRVDRLKDREFLGGNPMVVDRETPEQGRAHEQPNRAIVAPIENVPCVLWDMQRLRSRKRLEILTTRQITKNLSAPHYHTRINARSEARHKLCTIHLLLRCLTNNKNAEING